MKTEKLIEDPIKLPKDFVPLSDTESVEIDKLVEKLRQYNLFSLHRGEGKHSNIYEHYCRYCGFTVKNLNPSDEGNHDSECSVLKLSRMV